MSRSFPQFTGMGYGQIESRGGLLRNSHRESELCRSSCASRPTVPVLQAP